MKGREWLGKQVRVYSGQDRAKEYHPMVEGEVVAYIDGPSIIVRADNGHQSTWPVSLPIDEMARTIDAAQPHPMTANCNSAAEEASA